jgi:hypothetical protein
MFLEHGELRPTHFEVVANSPQPGRRVPRSPKFQNNWIHADEKVAEDEKVDGPLDVNAYLDAYHTPQGKTGFIDR